MKPRIVIADDHGMFRDGLRALLTADASLDVVGEAENGVRTLELVRELTPHILLLDVSMPGLNGIEVAQQLAEVTPRPDVIVLSMHADLRYVREALRAGARGYVLKEAGFPEVGRAIAAVCAGRVYLSPTVGEQVVLDYIRLIGAEGDDPTAELSPREREVLQLLAEGRPTKAIAAELNRSVKTVEWNRKQIMDKLGIRSIAELTKYAVREGLTPLE